MGLTLYVEPESEIITLQELKDQLKIDGHEQDSYLSSLIVAARQWAELHANRAFPLAAYKLTLDGFPEGREPIDLLAPLQFVTSITYLDADGVSRVLPSNKYRVLTNESPGKVEPAHGEVWPATQEVSAAVTIIFQAGYPEDASEGSSAPEAAKSAMKLYAESLYKISARIEDGQVIDQGKTTPEERAAEALLATLKVGRYP